MDSEDKQRISLYLDKETVIKMDEAIKKYDYRSRNDFVSFAVDNLIADKLLDENDTVISEKLSRSIAEMSEKQTLQIAKSMFRYCKTRRSTTSSPSKSPINRSSTDSSGRKSANISRRIIRTNKSAIRSLSCWNNGSADGNGTEILADSNRKCVRSTTFAPWKERHRQGIMALSVPDCP